jgi:hypothetical protein
MRLVAAFGALGLGLASACSREQAPPGGSPRDVETSNAAIAPADAAAQGTAPTASSASASVAPPATGAPTTASSATEEPTIISILTYHHDGEHPSLISRCVEIALPSPTTNPRTLGGRVDGEVVSATCKKAVKREPYAVCTGMKLPLTLGKPPVPVPSATTHYYHISAAVDGAVERSCGDAGGSWRLTDRGKARR